MIELKPCPFCSSTRLWTIRIGSLSKTRWWHRYIGKYYIECRMCRYCGKAKRGKRRAIKAWNRSEEKC